MDTIRRVNELLASEQSLCLATVVASGRPNVPCGLKVIVRKDGNLESEAEHVPLRSEIVEVAICALRSGRSETIEIRKGVRVFLDVLSADARLLICGAGHIALPLARFAREVGFRVTVLDDRSSFADPSRFPGCAVIAEEYASALRDFPLDSAAFAVVITRGHEHDADCLLAILPRQTAYVGLIGSRRRTRIVLEQLADRGITRERLNDIFTPIGLPIGGESPSEIALSIVAEIVCVRNIGSANVKLLRRAIGGSG